MPAAHLSVNGCLKGSMIQTWDSLLINTFNPWGWCVKHNILLRQPQVVTMSWMPHVNSRTRSGIFRLLSEAVMNPRAGNARIPSCSPQKELPET